MLLVVCLPEVLQYFMDLKLTGMQGDVMKESMAVAKTLSASLVDPKILQNLN